MNIINGCPQEATASLKTEDKSLKLRLLDAVELPPDVRGVHEVLEVRHGVRRLLRAPCFPLRQGPFAQYQRRHATPGSVIDDADRAINGFCNW